jgi:hypothetical protein
LHVLWRGSGRGGSRGAPHDEQKAYRMKDQKSLGKATDWVCDALTLFDLIIWVAVAQHPMRNHFRLFREGREATHRGMSWDSSSDLLFDYCSPARSPAVKVVNLLCYMLSPGHAQFKRLWQLLITALGPLGDRWPQLIIYKARTATL